MALMKCPECGNDVSTSAETCPHCGYRLKPSSHTTYYSNRASKIIEREHTMRFVGGVIASIIGIIISFVLFILAGSELARSYHEIKLTYIFGGLFLLIVCIITLIYSIYRLKNY